MTSLSPSATPGGRRYDLRGREGCSCALRMRSLCRSTNSITADCTNWLSVGPDASVSRIDSPIRSSLSSVFSSILALTGTIFTSAFRFAISAMLNNSQHPRQSGLTNRVLSVQSLLPFRQSATTKTTRRGSSARCRPDHPRPAVPTAKANEGKVGE
jgi:hypothetical protein